MWVGGSGGYTLDCMKKVRWPSVLGLNSRGAGGEQTLLELGRCGCGLSPGKKDCIRTVELVVYFASLMAWRSDEAGAFVIVDFL